MATPQFNQSFTSLTRVSLCIFGTGKAWPWYRDTPSFSWKETNFVFQSPKVPSKSDSYFLRSCSNFVCWSALRCLPLSLTTDWRSALLYLASRIHVACLVASYVRCGSMARLWLRLSAWRTLEPCRLLMFLIGQMISSMVIILYLKFKMIPNLSWSQCQEWGHTAAYYSCRIQPHQAPHCTFCYQNIWRCSAPPGLYAASERSHLKYSMTVEPAFLSREAAWVYLCSLRKGCHQNHCLTGLALFLLTVLVTALTGVTILRITPQHSNYCCGSTFCWIGSSRSTVIDMYILAFAWWCQHDIISIAKHRRIAKCCWIARRCQIGKLCGIVNDRWVTKGCWIAKYSGIAKDCLIAMCCWTSNVLILAIYRSLTILLLLADSEGVALIGLGGVKWDHLTAFSKFNPNFLVLLDPISYLLLELLSSLQHFLDLWEAFLRVFSNLSNFLLNWANDCFAGLGFLPAFLEDQKLAFTIPPFSYLRQSLVACIVCAPQCFLHSLQDFSKWTFLWACFVAPLLGCLAPALFLWEAFLPDGAWVFSGVHTRSIASREAWRECMFMGVIPFSCRLYWSCPWCRHIQRMWLARSA